MEQPLINMKKKPTNVGRNGEKVEKKKEPRASSSERRGSGLMRMLTKSNSRILNETKAPTAERCRATSGIPCVLVLG